MRAGDARQRFRQDGMQTISQERLVILLYERAGRDLADARAAIETGLTEPRHRALIHAQEIVEELAYAVRPDVWAAGEGLLELYEYVLERLVKANVDADLSALDEAALVIDQLTSAWRDAYLAIQAPAAP